MTVETMAKRLTLHGECRASERLNIKSKARRERQVALAWERGIGSDNYLTCPKKLISYIINAESKNVATTVKIYDCGVYVFSDEEALVTVWKLDKKYSKILESANRKRNRQTKIA